MNKIPSTFRSLLIMALLATAFPLASWSADARAADDTGTFLARRWMEAFQKLDSRNSITMVLSNRDSFYELENVVGIEAFSHFVVVRCKSTDGVFYHALVYPSTIMLVNEAPRSSVISRKPKEDEPAVPSTPTVTP